MVLKRVSLCWYTTCCLDFGCTIHAVQWCCNAVLVAFLPLPWLHGGHSPGLHDELSSSVLHGDLSCVHGGLPWLLGSHWLHGRLSSSALLRDLSSVHGGLPGLLGSLGLSVCQLLGSVLLGWISLFVQVLLIVSPSPLLWLIFFVWNET